MIVAKAKCNFFRVYMKKTPKTLCMHVRHVVGGAKFYRNRVKPETPRTVFKMIYCRAVSTNTQCDSAESMNLNRHT